MNQEKQSSWAARRAKASAGLGAQPNGAGLAIRGFLQEPVPSAFLGAALLSGQPCLLRNSDTVLNQVLKNDQRRLQASCWTVVKNLLEKIASNMEEQEGYTMLFHLLIEPFALMNQTTAFYPVGGVRPSAARE